MSYKLSLIGAELATFDLAVNDQETEVAGKPAIVVQTHAKVSGIGELAARAAGIHVDDTFTSWLDVTNGRPLRWYCEEYATKSTDKERTEARLAERTDGTVPIEFHVNDEPPKQETQTVSMPDVWDYNAFLIALRAWEGPPGSTVSAEVLRSRYLWHVDMKIRGKEQLHTALGDFPALRLDGHTYKLGARRQEARRQRRARLHDLDLRRRRPRAPRGQGADRLRRRRDDDRRLSARDRPATAAVATSAGGLRVLLGPELLLALAMMTLS